MINLKDPPFKKPNTALVMMPKVGKLTATGRKLFNSMLNSAQKQLTAIRETGGSFESHQFFEAYLVDIVRPIGNPRSNSQEMMKDNIREMQSVRVEWTSPDAVSGVIWESMVLISQAKLTIESGKVRLLWSFPPDIVTSLCEPDSYTIIRLEELAKLSTYAAVALYEICTRFGENPTHKTSRKPKEWWVNALSSDSHKRSAKDKTVYVPRDWRMFKSEKVKPAIKEINEKTNLSIELIEHKEGLAVKEVQFAVRRSSGKSVSNEVLEDATSGPCYMQAARLGISAKDITVFLNEDYTENQIVLGLVKCEARLNRSDLPVIANITSYLRKVLADDKEETSAGGSPKDQVSDAPKEKGRLSKTAKVEQQTSQPKQTPEPVVSELKQVNSLITPAANSLSKFEMLREELRILAKDKQDEYVLLARQSLESKGVLTAYLKRRLDMGDWSSPVMLHEVVGIYAAQQYGQDLAQPDSLPLQTGEGKSTTGPQHALF